MKPTRRLLVIVFSTAGLLLADHRRLSAAEEDAATRREIEQLRVEFWKELTRQAQEIKGLKEENAALQKRVATTEKKIPSVAKKETTKEKKSGASAQDRSAEAVAEAMKEDTKHFSTPDSPAAAVLGIAPEKVIHATTPKQLVMATVNGLDDKGHFQTGFAVDFAPAQLFPKILERHPVITSYRETGDSSTFSWEDYAIAVARRTQLSFAAIRGTEDADKSSKLALGVNVTLMDAEDPLVSGGYRYSGGARSGDLAALAGPEALNPDLNIQAPFREEGVGRLMNILYRHASWSVGGAATWLSTDPEEEDYEYAGATLWSTFTFSFAKPRGLAGSSDAEASPKTPTPDKDGLYPKAPYRLLLHARYDDQQSIPAGDAVNPPHAGVDPATGTPLPAPTFVDQDSLLAVGAFRFGRKDFNATGSVAYVKRWQRSGGSGNEDSLLYSISAEKRIGDGPMWVTLSLGKEVGGANDGNTIILGGVRLGFDSRSFGSEDTSSR